MEKVFYYSCSRHPPTTLPIQTRGATANLSQARPTILSQFFDQLFLIRVYWNPKFSQGPGLGCLASFGASAFLWVYTKRFYLTLKKQAWHTAHFRCVTTLSWKPRGHILNTRFENKPDTRSIMLYFTTFCRQHTDADAARCCSSTLRFYSDTVQWEVFVF